MEFIKKGSVLSKGYCRDEMIVQDIDDADSDRSLRHNKLSEAKAKKYFRHLVLGLDYCKKIAITKSYCS